MVVAPSSSLRDLGLLSWYSSLALNSHLTSNHSGSRGPAEARRKQVPVDFEARAASAEVVRQSEVLEGNP